MASPPRPRYTARSQSNLTGSGDTRLKNKIKSLCGIVLSFKN